MSYHYVIVVFDMFSASLLTCLATRPHTRLLVRCKDETPKHLYDLGKYLPAITSFMRRASYTQGGRNFSLNDRVLWIWPTNIRTEIFET
jgi:hypothetical protein